MTAASASACKSDDRSGVSVLSGLRVLDVSDSVAGQFAGRIFADYGAHTRLVEVPSGSSVRRLGPFNRKVSPPDDSLLFFHLNTGKSSVCIDWKTASGRAKLEELAGEADVLITDDARLSRELSRQFPNLVVCVITEFAGTGPYAHWKGSELIHQALGGLMFMTGRAGEEPLFGFGHRAYYSAGAAAAAGTLAALCEREQSGRGQIVAVNVHETAVSMCQHVVSQYSYNGTFPVRGVYPTGGVDIFKCSDGWVVLYCRSDHWEAFCCAFGAEEIGRDPDFAPALYVRNWLEAHRRVSPYLAVLPVAEVVARAQSVRAVAAKVMSVADVLSCEHFAARNFWDRTTEGERILGPLFRMATDDRRIVTPAPQLSRSVVNPPKCGMTATRAGSRYRAASHDASAPRPPLAGIRVMEMTTAWAGPMLGRILAHLGAEVVKIESTAVMDVFRGEAKGGSSTQYPKGHAGTRPYNRAVAFNTQNLSKRSLNLNLKAPQARDVAQRLAKASDVVICNFSPRAMRGLGLDYDTLRAIRDDIIMVELPAAGSGGPLSDITGVGHTMEALAGMTSLQGYSDGAPQRTGPAYLDPIGAFNGAIAVLLALYDRYRNGHGRRIELAQIEASMQWLGEWLLLYDRTGEIPMPNGNQIPNAAPHGAYRTRGEDEWIAVGVFDEAEWRELCIELDAPGIAVDPRFDSLLKRLNNEAELRTEIEHRTRNRDKHELAFALQRRGVHAAPVCSGKDIHDDPQLEKTEFFLHVDHPEAGRHRYHGFPFHFSLSQTSQTLPAPILGEHTDLVLRTLGIDDESIAHLKEAAVVSQADDAAGNPELAPGRQLAAYAQSAVEKNPASNSRGVI